MMLVESNCSGAVCTITLNDPERLNVLSEEMVLSLRASIAQVSRDTRVRCVLLTGNGQRFCAGGDVKSLDTLKPAEVTRFIATTQSMVQAISELPVPVVVAVNGAAAGAGFSLALSGDVLIAARAAVFFPSFLRIGVVPDLGLIHALHRSVGLHRTTDILLRGKPIDAPAAEAFGLVSEVVPDAELARRSRAVAEELAAGPTVALGLTKRLIRLAAMDSLAGFLLAEAAAQGVAFSTGDFREGVAAFRQRRQASFEGR